MKPGKIRRFRGRDAIYCITEHRDGYEMIRAHHKTDYGPPVLHPPTWAQVSTIGRRVDLDLSRHGHVAPPLHALVTFDHAWQLAPIYDVVGEFEVPGALLRPTYFKTIAFIRRNGHFMERTFTIP